MRLILLHRQQQSARVAQRPANPVPASLQGRQRDKDTTAVIYGGIDMYTDEHGFKTADAPELLEAAKAVTGMLELFIDEQRIKTAADGVHRDVEEGAAKLEALRASIAKAEGR